MLSGDNIQATILLMVPYETHEEDIVVSQEMRLGRNAVNSVPQVTIERNYLVVGVHGKPPVVKVWHLPLHSEQEITSFTAWLAGTFVQSSGHDQLRMAARNSDQQTFGA